MKKFGDYITENRDDIHYVANFDDRTFVLLSFNLNGPDSDVVIANGWRMTVSQKKENDLARNSMNYLRGPLASTHTLTVCGRGYSSSWPVRGNLP